MKSTLYEAYGVPHELSTEILRLKAKIEADRFKQRIAEITPALDRVNGSKWFINHCFGWDVIYDGESFFPDYISRDNEEFSGFAAFRRWIMGEDDITAENCPWLSRLYGPAELAIALIHQQAENNGYHDDDQ